MGIWFLAPLAAAAAPLGLAVLAWTRKGSWRGRTFLSVALLCCALCLVCVSIILSGVSSVLVRPAADVLLPGTLVAATCWMHFFIRFGRRDPGVSGNSFLIAIGTITPAVLMVWGILHGGLTWANHEFDGLMATLRTGPVRGTVGFLILIAAFGVVRFQALRIASLRARKGRLARASLGFLIGSLGLFLHASQALLYGGAALRVLALGSLGLIPVTALMIPLFTSRDPEEALLPPGVQTAASSMIFMGLGVYLIGLAVMGNAIHWLLPASAMLWFHWGGAFVLLGLGSVFLVPGLRERLTRWFAPAPYSPARAAEELARFREPLHPGERFPALLVRVGPMVESMLGRTGMALWITAPGGRFVPWTVGESSLPVLEETNPLLRDLRVHRKLLDLTDPPVKATQIPTYAQNVDLLQRQGFCLFVNLVSQGREVGVLGLAPRERRLQGEDRLFVEQLAEAVAEAVAASLPASSEILPGEAGAMTTGAAKTADKPAQSAPAGNTR